MVRASRSPKGKRNSGRGSPPPARMACSAPDSWLPDRGVGEPGEARMGHRMVAQPVAARHDRRDSRRVRGGPVAGEEERAAHPGGGQGLQDAGQPGGVGSGVERQRHHLAGPRNHLEVAAGERGGERCRRGRSRGCRGRRRRCGRRGRRRDGGQRRGLGRNRFAGGGDRNLRRRRTRRRAVRRAGRSRNRRRRRRRGRRRRRRLGRRGHRRQGGGQHHRGGQQKHRGHGRQPSATVGQERPHASRWHHRPQPG